MSGRRLSIAITCFPTIGGSGIVATEIGLGMARRGHEVHFVSAEVPVRLDRATDGVFFHEVRTGEHAAIAGSGTYPLALCSRLVEVATYAKIDVMHVHYAVPHAAAAWMAREVIGPGAPPLITTLHGTDITLVAADPSYLPVTRHAILRSDAVTTPSRFLRDETLKRLQLPPSTPIEVISNFVDAERYAPGPNRHCLRRLFPDLGTEELVLMHASNFRPLKRLDDVVAIFAAVAATRPARLLLVGDGPERSRVEAEVRSASLGSRVALVGRQESCADWLRAADLFLLPSETESFGLAALEAMACGVPVLASDVGGLAEVVVDGVGGRLLPMGDRAAFVQATLALAADEDGRAAMGVAARRRAVEHFGQREMLDRYEALYRKITSTL